MFGFSDALTRRRAKAARTAHGALADYYRQPVPEPTTPIAALPMLAIDVETTGLKPGQDAVLSVGFVPLDGEQIVLAGAAEYVLQGSDVGQSATIHGITDDVVAAGVPPVEALAHTLNALAGRVLLAHHHVIEVDFISHACQRYFGAPLVVPAIDTMLLHHRIIASGFDDEPARDALRLWNARARYRLPRYDAHGALTDALACGELFLAQVAELGGSPTLKTYRA